MTFSEIDHRHMRRALELAARGQGHVEPNPMVGCVIADGNKVLAEGWHGKFGEAHAEVDALQRLSEPAGSATMYITLESCCHRGKTPPCTDAIRKSGITRVIVAAEDPFQEVAGQGMATLRAAGVHVTCGLLSTRSQALNAPYLRLVQKSRPWVIAKWAMTLDGKLATRERNSQWISNAASREIVHRLRGRMDAIVVGSGTVETDDPLLTARPAGPRIATRVVLDSPANLAAESQLVRTASDVPVLVVAGPHATEQAQQRLRDAGCEIFQTTEDHRLDEVLNELGRRQFTNILVEGGSRILGSFFAARAVDEVHVFVAPKLVGGAEALSPVAGHGISDMASAIGFSSSNIEIVGDNVYISGRLDTT
jgi:diaminohydroxyphosphoribosylaminopyrimidine deaminase/5-amino-6-(5-phosphoribosylamino)uracil reductase